MQSKLNKKLAEFDEQEFEYDYKSGSVVVNIMGNFKIVKINVNSVLIDPEDKVTLEEMVQEAINSAYDGVKADRDQIQQAMMPKGM